MTEDAWKQLTEQQQRAILRLSIRMLKNVHGLYRPLTGITRTK